LLYAFTRPITVTGRVLFHREQFNGYQITSLPGNFKTIALRCHFARRKNVSHFHNQDQGHTN